MLAGGCHCGACRYTIAAEALPAAYCCHCLACQSWSGSAFAEQVVMAEETLAIAGPVVDYCFVNPSGSTSWQRICGTCHTRLYNTNSARPGIAVVRAGTLDDSDRLTAKAHIWVKRKQPWVVIADDVPTWPEGAPPEALWAALRG